MVKIFLGKVKVFNSGGGCQSNQSSIISYSLSNFLYKLVLINLLFQSVNLFEVAQSTAEW